MAWARIDDNFFNHPKVRKSGKDAIIFYVAALCHCNAFLTEGFIADDMLDLVGMQAFQRRPKELADRLVECDLLDRVEGGYLIHDFLDYNYSRTQIEEIKSKRSDAGKQGGRPAKANEKQNESKMKANEKQNESHTHTHVNTHTDEELKDKPAAAYSGKNSELYVAFEAITPVTERIATAIDSAVNIYSAGWVRDAIAEATGKGKTFGYVNSILERWKREGRNGAKPTKYDAIVQAGTYEAWSKRGAR